MSDVKKYYYMRLVENFFDRPEIKVIEKIENGFQFIAILQKMYLKSLNRDGMLMFADEIPYDINMLSATIGHEKIMIEKAIEIFQKFKLIEIMDDGAMYMLHIQNFIGESSSEADRKRIFRAKINKHKQIGHLSDNRPPELELNTDINKDIELKQKKNKSFIKPNIQDIKEYFSLKKYIISAEKFLEYYTISNWHDKNGNPVKNWKLKAHTWNDRELSKKEKQSQPSKKQISTSSLQMQYQAEHDMCDRPAADDPKFVAWAERYCAKNNYTWMR